MIRVRKPAHAPATLRERGVALTAKLCERVDAGEIINFDDKSRAVYGAADVKQALRTAQHDKCCFCESKLGHAQFGDVEHFRPKKACAQHSKGPFTIGYYWLAYAWENLYLSCEVCNRRHKRGLFPLANPGARVSSHHRSAELVAEQPLFVDPGHDDPALSIEFRREYAAPIDGSPRGSATIEALQLNRPQLVERRRERRQDLLANLTLVGWALRHDELPEDIRPRLVAALDAIINASSDSGQYAAMTRSLLRSVVPWRDSWRRPVESLLDALRADAARGLRFNLGDLVHTKSSAK